MRALSKIKYLLLPVICAAIWFSNSSLRNSSSELDTLPSKLEYAILQGSKVEVAGATNINEFSCFSNDAYPKKTSDFYFNAGRTTMFFQNAVLHISLESLDCGNEVMNANLCKTLNGDKFPFITVELMSVEAKNGKPLDLSNSLDMIAKVQIVLAGERRNDEIAFSGKQLSSGNYHFTGSHQLSLSDYHLTPPTAFFGLIKVKDTITVKFDLLVNAHAVMVE